jgi:transposase
MFGGFMAYKTGNNPKQSVLIPTCLDDVIPQNCLARVYRNFIDSLSYEELGVRLDCYRAGNSEYDPKIMFKILAYGYSTGRRSSRKIEEALYYNLDFMFIANELKPDHKTIARFRKAHPKQLKKLLKLTVKLSAKMGMIKGNLILMDGTKMAGNCSRAKFVSKEKLDVMIKESTKYIDVLMKQAETFDVKDSKEASLISLKLESEKKFNARLQRVFEEIKKENLEEVNLTDPQSVKLKTRRGSCAGLNMLVTVEGTAGLIVATNAVRKSNDIDQIYIQTHAAQENMGMEVNEVCADSGFHNRKEMGKLIGEGKNVIVPGPKEVHKERTGEDKEFDKDKFVYDKEKDEYICPQGKVLKRIKEKKDGLMVYKEKNHECKRCKNFGVCTRSKSGREVQRFSDEDEAILEQVERAYKSPHGQIIYKQRQGKCEAPHGHIKHNLKTTSTLVRGVEGADADFSMGAVDYNLKRLVTMFGAAAVIAAMWA